MLKNLYLYQHSISIYLNNLLSSDDDLTEFECYNDIPDKQNYMKFENISVYQTLCNQYQYLSTNHIIHKDTQWTTIHICVE